MPRIVETILTTRNAADEVHIAPLGLIEADRHWLIAPFRPSRTLDNLRVVPFATANHTDDVRVFAGCLTGHAQWQTRRADHINGAVLEGALSHWELSVDHVEEHALRPRFHCRIVHQVAHAPFAGFNRAQAAVIEAAILVSRLDMLPQAKIESEIAYLAIAVSKTAGPREQEAWSWIEQRIASWRRSKVQSG
jgi:hypothetical protein